MGNGHVYRITVPPTPNIEIQDASLRKTSWYISTLHRWIEKQNYPLCLIFFKKDNDFNTSQHFLTWPNNQEYSSKLIIAEDKYQQNAEKFGGRKTEIRSI